MLELGINDVKGILEVVTALDAANNVEEAATSVDGRTEDSAGVASVTLLVG